MKPEITFSLGLIIGVCLVVVFQAAMATKIVGNKFDPYLISIQRERSYCKLKIEDGRDLEWEEAKSQDGYSCHNPFSGGK